MGTLHNGARHRAYRRAQTALERRNAAADLRYWWCGGETDIALPAGHRDASTADYPDARANGGCIAGQELQPLRRHY